MQRMQTFWQRRPCCANTETGQRVHRVMTYKPGFLLPGRVGHAHGDGKNKEKEQGLSSSAFDPANRGR
jgi:hypothetical protein